MLNGLYVVRRNGVEVARAKNIITNAGKTLILRYLSEYIGSFSGGIAVGAGVTTPSATDTDLQYEWDRADVLVRSADYDNNKITFLATLPQSSEGVVTELGLWSATENPHLGEYQPKLLLVGDSDVENWQGTFDWDNTNFRVGSQAIALVSGSETSLSDIGLDLSGYVNATFRMAYFAGTATNIIVKFTDVAGNAHSDTIGISAGSGLKFVDFPKDTSTDIDWSNVVTISLQSNGTVTFDSMRINVSEDELTDYGLVSRAAVSAFTKDNTAEYELAYTMGFGIE